MIAKEWRDARWKFAVAAVVVVLVALIAPTLTPYRQLEKMAKHTYGISEVSIGKNASAGRSGDSRVQKASKPPENLQQAPRDPVEMAAREMWALYGVGGSVVLLPLAVLLGAPLISGEVSGGTISMLLCRPISRTRLLMSKYVVGATGLLVSAVLGGALVAALAAARGYPLGKIGLAGIALSAVLIWLGSLFVLGVGLLASVLLRSVIGSIVASVAALLLVFIFPSPFTNYSSWLGHALGISRNAVQKLFLPQYWYSESLYAGHSLVPTHFLIGMVAAALPLIVALVLFRRRAY